MYTYGQQTIYKQMKYVVAVYGETLHQFILTDTRNHHICSSIDFHRLSNCDTMLQWYLALLIIYKGKQGEVIKHAQKKKKVSIPERLLIRSHSIRTLLFGQMKMETRSQGL